MKYLKLKSEMVLHKKTNKDLAEVLGLSEQSIYSKLTGRQTLTLKEAVLIRDAVNPEISVDELFKE